MSDPLKMETWPKPLRILALIFFPVTIAYFISILSLMAAFLILYVLTLPIHWIISIAYFKLILGDGRRYKIYWDTMMLGDVKYEDRNYIKEIKAKKQESKDNKHLKGALSISNDRPNPPKTVRM